MVSEGGGCGFGLLSPNRVETWISAPEGRAGWGPDLWTPIEEGEGAQFLGLREEGVGVQILGRGQAASLSGVEGPGIPDLLGS